MPVIAFPANRTIPPYKNRISEKECQALITKGYNLITQGIAFDIERESTEDGSYWVAIHGLGPKRSAVIASREHGEYVLWDSNDGGDKVIHCQTRHFGQLLEAVGQLTSI